MDLGKFNGRILLTGAGWSRNWGGRLASQLWEDLIGHPAIQENARLRELLQSEPSFEVALAKVRETPFASQDQQIFEKVILDAFVSMDRQIAQPHSPWIN